jgi:hypothetical protein
MYKYIAKIPNALKIAYLLILVIHDFSTCKYFKTSKSKPIRSESDCVDINSIMIINFMIYDLMIKYNGLVFLSINLKI